MTPTYRPGDLLMLPWTGPRPQLMGHGSRMEPQPNLVTTPGRAMVRERGRQADFKSPPGSGSSSLVCAAGGRENPWGPLFTSSFGRHFTCFQAGHREYSAQTPPPQVPLTLQAGRPRPDQMDKGPEQAQAGSTGTRSSLLPGRRCFHFKHSG